MIFTYPDPECPGSSLSSQREARLNDKVGQGEEGESNKIETNTDI